MMIICDHQKLSHAPVLLKVQSEHPSAGAQGGQFTETLIGSSVYVCRSAITMPVNTLLVEAWAICWPGDAPETEKLLQQSKLLGNRMLGP